MKQHNQPRERLLLKGAAVFFGLMLLMSAILLGVSWWENSHKGPESTTRLEKEITYNGQTYVLKENVETMLVIGLDTYENQSSEAYRNDKQADFLTLLVMDKESGSCKAIQINRDTMAQIDVLGVNGKKVSTAREQIALSHTYGTGKEDSCENTVMAVSNLLGVDINYYVSVSMDAVPIYNDLIGGVPVEILDDFTAFDPTMVVGETVTLNGKQALSYVRTRQGLEDPSNTQRMKRQRQYLQSMLEVTGRKLEEDKAFMADAIDQLKPYWVSNRTKGALADMISRYHINDPVAFYTIEGDYKMGAQYLEFYPDAESVLKTVVECFYVPAK